VNLFERFFFLEVPLSATFFGEEQGEPLNPLAVVRKRVAFACDDGVWFHFFGPRGSGILECGAGQHGAQEREGVAGPRLEDGLGQRPLGALVDARLRWKTCLSVCVEMVRARAYDDCQPSGFSAEPEGTRPLWRWRALGHGRD